MKLDCLNESEARTLAARFLPGERVQITINDRHGSDSARVRWGEDLLSEMTLERAADAVLFVGMGSDAMKIRPEPSWTLTPDFTAGAGVWMHLNVMGLKVLSWDGLGSTPAEELNTKLPTFWCGPLPHFPSITK